MGIFMIPDPILWECPVFLIEHNKRPEREGSKRILDQNHYRVKEPRVGPRDTQNGYSDSNNSLYRFGNRFEEPRDVTEGSAPDCKDEN